MSLLILARMNFSTALFIRLLLGQMSASAWQLPDYTRNVITLIQANLLDCFAAFLSTERRGGFKVQETDEATARKWDDEEENLSH